MAYFNCPQNLSPAGMTGPTYGYNYIREFGPVSDVPRKYAYGNVPRGLNYDGDNWGATHTELRRRGYDHQVPHYTHTPETYYSHYNLTP